jgi:hypothetical protein
MDEGLKDEWKSSILSPFVFSMKKAMSNIRFNKTTDPFRFLVSFLSFALAAPPMGYAQQPLLLDFAENDAKANNPQQRSIQRPRVFYRRELETRPFIVARP